MKKIALISYLLICMIVLAEGVLHRAVAEDGYSDIGERSNPFKLSATYLYQSDADIEDGGDFHVERLLFRADWRGRKEGDFRFGAGFHYEYHDYSLSGSGRLTELNHWGGVNRFGFSLPLSYQFQKDLSFFLAPSVEYSGATGADFGDSLAYGGIFSLSNRISPNLLLGIGFGVFNQIEDTSIFPAILVDWRITENLKLANPLRPGSTGPAGLELSYRLNSQWEVAAGGAYRSLRFRLAEIGVVPDGVGEESGYSLWGRVSWMHASGLQVDVMSGAIVGGELEVDDYHGDRLHREDYDTAPICILTLSIPL